VTLDTKGITVAGGSIAPEALETLGVEFREMMGIAEDGTIPALDPELVSCLVVREAGLMVNHPLVHSLYMSVENGRFNKLLEWKKSEIARLEAEGEYADIFYIGLVERPYRLEWLLKYADDMPDQAWWELAGFVWTDSENIWQHHQEWREVFASDRPGREYMMDEDEREIYAALPDRIKVYRGTNAPDKLGSGLSWTQQRRVATWFANRIDVHQSGKYLIAGEVRKENVIAVFDGRSEHEVVCLPEHVKNKMTKRVQT
jgi:hypothetical protein